jgi:hypothetical protein
MTEYVKTITLSAADILALYAGGTPANGKQLLPAPGAGRTYIIKSLVFNYLGVNAAGATATAYAAGGAVGAYMGAVLQTATVAASVLVAGGATASITRVIPASGVIVANTAVTLANASAAFTTGDGLAEVVITYNTVNV